MESPDEPEEFEGSHEEGIDSHSLDESPEDWVTQGVHPTERGSAEQLSEPVHLTEREHRWHEESAAQNYAQENDMHVPVSPDPSDTLETMQEQRPSVNNYAGDEEEAEEFVVLGSDHELVKRQQAALSIELNKELERINLALKEKLELDKANESEIADGLMEIHRVNENLVRLQYKLEDLHQTKAQAENKHHQTLKQLESNKSQFSSIANQHKQMNARVSQLQSEMDSLMRHLTFTQEDSNELHSNIKARKKCYTKQEAKKLHAEEQKLKQDLYVERLTKDLERLTEQAALYSAQTSAQADETQAAKEALSEAETEMTSLLMAHKQLLQQWNSSLIGMRRRGEAYTAMQEAERKLEHQLLSLDNEIKSFKKTITAAQEQNEILTMQLNRAQIDNATNKSLINQKQAQQEAMQTHYSTILRTLRETERTLAQLTKEISNLEAEVKDQRRQMEKESALRLELEDKIESALQQKLTHNKATKYSQKLFKKLSEHKKEKITQLWQLEDEIVAADLENSEIGQNLDNLEFTQKTLDEELAKMDKLLSDKTSKISSSLFLIGQKQNIITKIKKKIAQIAAATGTEDLSPMQIKADAMKVQIEELEANKNREHQLWIQKQHTLVGLTQELEKTSKNILQLETEYTCLQQEKIRIENLIEGECRDGQNMQKNTQVLRRDLNRLSTLLSKNIQLSQTLKQDNALMQTDFAKKLQEEELKSSQMRMKWEKTTEEKERLSKCLVEAERQIMLWEKKIQIVKETYAAVQGVGEQADIQRMKAEIHRMEVRLTQLMRDRERLLRESEAVVARRETIVLRRESLLRSSPYKQSTKGQLQRLNQSLQRKINTTHKQMTECEQVIGELQESQLSVGSRLSQQKQQIIDLCGNSFALEQDLANLQDTKKRKLSHLVVLQNRSKKLQSVKDNSYKPVSNIESIGAALHNQTERVSTISTILQRVCEDFPQHQGALRQLTLALSVHAQ
ncbi:LOW QUALITY PROTEIN: coiled-coil domain-containing protein 40 [Boleophthalmus pectinirostris]|uniref:LOW QUALITY PROTEIN: coiled-coil domain-containing protein 40 n=1 Tax=Boleophthalmus pectinirostris TaxID=150288 RepID=UPI00242E6992|nr:LOW QUALITY PROTEIN: coiled-coil domain-containing protein 40 [Boleophthalmus pectinirostris]